MAKRAAAKAGAEGGLGFDGAGGGGKGGGSKGGGGGGLTSPSVRIVLLIGPDLYAREEALRTVLKTCEKAHGEVDVLYLSGTTATPAGVLDECRSMGLIAHHKIIVVDDAEKLIVESTREVFIKYAESPAAGSTLVLRSTKLVPGNLGKAVERVGAVVECKPPDRGGAVAWVLNECAKRHGIGIEQQAAELLVDRVGPFLAQLNTELAKLATAALDGPVITPALVSEFTAKTKEEGVFDLQAKISQLVPSRRFEEIRHLIYVNRESPTFILWVLADLSRKLHGAARGQKANINAFALKGKLKIWGGGADAILEVAKATDPGRLLNLFRSCVNADKRCKSGFGDPEIHSLLCAARFPRPDSGGRR